MNSPATEPDDLPIAAWTVLIAKAAALGFITPDHVGTGPAGYRTRAVEEGAS